MDVVILSLVFAFGPSEIYGRSCPLNIIELIVNPKIYGPSCPLNIVELTVNVVILKYI